MANKHHDNVFLRHSVHTAAPWLVKRGEKQRRIIQGLHGEPIGYINRHGHPDINNDQYRANCNLIQHAPQLLAACKEMCVIIEDSLRNKPSGDAYTVAEAFGDTTQLRQLISAAESTQVVDHPTNELSHNPIDPQHDDLEQQTTPHAHDDD